MAPLKAELQRGVLNVTKKLSILEQELVTITSKTNLNIGTIASDLVILSTITSVSYLQEEISVTN